MIYDNNDASIIFLPEKRLTDIKYINLVINKVESIKRSGMHPTNSSYKRRTMSGSERWIFIFCLVIYFVIIPGALYAAEFIESPIIYFLLTPIFIAFPIVACILAFLNNKKIRKYQKYSAVCVGYLHWSFTGNRSIFVRSTPLYRLETVNGPLFVYCSFTRFHIGFPEIGQSRILYISDKGPEECYDNNGKGGIIISFVTLGISILFNLIVLIMKIL